MLNLCALSLFTTACAQNYDQELARLYKNTVPTISVDSLRAIMGQESLYILDTRQEKEFAISHLQGAEFVDYDAFEIESVEHIPQGATVVVYCSVGYRSERIGEKLQEAGYNTVYNLYGGIFQWKNEGEDVVDMENNITENVHTYNRRWGRWLKVGKKVF